MTKQTKLELVQINAALAADNAALRKQVADLQLAAELRAAPAQDVAPASPPWEVSANAPAWQAERVVAMAKAKAAAMAGDMVMAAHARFTTRAAYVAPAWQAERALAMAAAKAAAIAGRCMVRA